MSQSENSPSMRGIWVRGNWKTRKPGSSTCMAFGCADSVMAASTAIVSVASLFMLFVFKQFDALQRRLGLAEVQALARVALVDGIEQVVA